MTAGTCHRPRTCVSFACLSGVFDLPRYLSLHTLACLTRQGAEQLAVRFASARDVVMHRVEVNMVEGKMLVEFESSSREVLEAWLRSEGFHFDWLMRIELEFDDGKLVPVP
jgi:hypothetical protein